MDFLKVIQICNTTSFRGEVKPSAPCCKILWHVKDPLKYDRDTDRRVWFNQSIKFWWMNQE
jgi:hypothetical protein